MYYIVSLCVYGTIEGIHTIGKGARNRMDTNCKLPDPGSCKNREVFNDIHKCLTSKEEGMICPYEIPFGGRYYCRHPDRAKFKIGGRDTDTDEK